MAIPWRSSVNQKSTSQPEKTVSQTRRESLTAIVTAVEAALEALENHSQIALNIASLSRQHLACFGERPMLRELVSTDNWPIVLIAQPVGIGRVVTTYIISDDGDVSLERNYTQSHIDTTRDSNVFTSVPPRL